MSAFKHMVGSDTDHVIFNLDELADLHEVVALYARAWVEMGTVKRQRLTNRVVLYARAWVERGPSG